LRIPRVMIAGTNSGCGKTTISAGIMAALVKKGIRVQPFKTGPDYIDPMFHTFVTGRYSRNLDSWLLGKSTLEHLFCKNSEGCEISVIEGVMGFYDGFGGSSIEGSTAHVSRILKCPVILVVNVQGMSLSAAALIKGFMDFMGGADVQGVILNRISSHALYTHLKDIITENTGVKVLGYIPQSEEYVLPERHLGLVPGGEVPELTEKLDRLAETVSKTIDLELLMKIAEAAPEPDGTAELLSKKLLEDTACKDYNKVRIGVAMDSAFSFYYRDNLELLELMGAELEYFSPIKDKKMPEGVDAVYFGGGYPEVFAEELSANAVMRKDVRERLHKGLPAYAECGGLMYLCRTMKDMRGNAFDMAGVIPAHCEMTGKLQRFGYVDVNITDECILGKSGFTTRAHEFHYSVLNPYKSGLQDMRSCYEVVKKKREGSNIWKDGWKIKNTLAGYPHIHFWSNPDFARRFIDAALASKGRKQ